MCYQIAMSRPLRIEYSGAWYHVMNRGRRGEEIFSDRKDFEAFLTVVRESCEMFDFRVAAYCLMSNHYHLLVQTPAGNLSRVMRHVNGVYTQRYNRRWKTDGQLFRGRYKSILVDQDPYLLELLRYIHRNPVRAGMCESVKGYSWTSHQGYLSTAPKWDWLHKHTLLGMFADQPSPAKRAYSAFVQLEDSQEIAEFFSKKNLSSVLGSAEFIDWVKGKFYQQKQDDEVPESRRLAPTLTEIRLAVCQEYNIDEGVLAQSRRGEVNEPRNVAIYLARKLSGLRLAEIGQGFGLLKYSSVSSIVLRTERIISKQPALQKRLKRIKNRLDKSQAKI